MIKRGKWYSILVLGLCLVLAITVAGCTQNPRYVYENGAIHVGGDGKPIELIDNHSATNPTYAELVAFIRGDSTDRREYFRTIPPHKMDYICSDFAEDVHNNAETAGIRAAWVSVEFQGTDEGHALNAFETTDRGLVYIDCTGGQYRGLPREIHIELYKMATGHAPPPKPTSWDCVAYVEIGREYGLIDIAKTELPQYSFYVEYTSNWQTYENMLEDFNNEVMRFNQEVTGKVYYEGSLELARMEAWEAELKRNEQRIKELEDKLGRFWFEPLGVVKDIHIHWGGAQ